MVVNVSIVMFLIQGLLADRILIKDLLFPERREVIILIIILNQLLLMVLFLIIILNQLLLMVLF